MFYSIHIKRERLYAQRCESIFYATRGTARFAVRHGIIYFSFDRWRPHFLICMQIVTSKVYTYDNFLSFSFSNFLEFLIDSKEKASHFCYKQCNVVLSLPVQRYYYLLFPGRRPKFCLPRGRWDSRPLCAMCAWRRRLINTCDITFLNNQ